MMMMMKTSVLLVICTLLFSSLSVLASQNTFSPEECCFKFVQKKLPKYNVRSYRWTDAKCAKDAVILTMKKGDLCANPAEEWVMNIIKDQERKKELLNSNAKTLSPNVSQNTPSD